VVANEPPAHLPFVRRLLNEDSSPPEIKGTDVQLERVTNDWIIAVQPAGGQFDADLCRVAPDGRSIVALVDGSLVKLDARDLQIERAVEAPWANKLAVCSEGVLIIGDGQMALMNAGDLSVRAVYSIDGNVSLIGATLDCSKIALATKQGANSTENTKGNQARLMLIDFATRELLLDCELDQLCDVSPLITQSVSQEPIRGIEQVTIDPRGYLLTVQFRRSKRTARLERNIRVHMIDDNQIAIKGETNWTESAPSDPRITPDRNFVFVCHRRGKSYSGGSGGSESRITVRTRIEKYSLNRLERQPVLVIDRNSDSFVFYGDNELLVNDTTLRDAVLHITLAPHPKLFNLPTWAIKPEASVGLKKLERLLPLADEKRLAGVGEGRLFLFRLSDETVGSEDVRAASQSAADFDSYKILESRSFLGQPEQLSRVAFSPDGKLVVTAGRWDELEKPQSAGVLIFDVATRKLKRVIRPNASSVVAMEFDSVGNLITSDASGWIQRWSIDTGRLVREHSIRFTQARPKANAIGIDERGRLVAAVLTGPEPSGQNLRRGGFGGRSSDSNENFAHTLRGALFLWNDQDKKLVRLEGDDGQSWQAAFSPDASLCAIGGRVSGFRIYQSESGELMQWSDWGRDEITILQFSPDGKLLVVGDRSGQLMLWDVESRGKLTELHRQGGRVAEVAAFSPDGRKLAFDGGDGKIYFWDVQNKTTTTSFNVSSGKLADAAFSPDGRQLALGYSNGKLELYDVDDASNNSITSD
jgi:WD40 repeat protein